MHLICQAVPEFYKIQKILNKSCKLTVYIVFDI